jgi:arsenate reductase
MAEGFAKHYLSKEYDSYSAGIETHGLNPSAVNVMSEIGIDISNYESTNISDYKDIEFDLVVTVCGHADENCPLFLKKSKVVHVGFEDPPKLAADLADKGATESEQLDCYRQVRDQIKDYVKKLVRMNYELQL